MLEPRTKRTSLTIRVRKSEQRRGSGYFPISGLTMRIGWPAPKVREEL